MLHHYKILTVTHRQTDLRAIGKFIVPHEDDDILRAKLEILKETCGLDELLYLATCNRVMYLFSTEKNIHQRFIQQFFSQANLHFEPADAAAIECYEGLEAVRHLYEVASSVDSLVVGESEIFRQLRAAFEQAKSWSLSGDYLRLLMRFTVEAAKDVFAHTQIGEKPVSIVSLAMQQLFLVKKPEHRRLLIVGAGQTNELVSKFLVKKQFSDVAVFNRNIKKAVTLADNLGGKAYDLSQLESYTKGFDCIIVCTGATEVLITDALYAKLNGTDTHEKIAIDLSVPNNISQNIVQQHNVRYIEVESLRQLAKDNLAFRKKEVEKAKEILQKKLTAFQVIHRQRQLEYALRDVPNQIQAVKSHAMNEVFKKDLEGLDDNARAVVSNILTYMEKRCISIPMLAAKSAAS